MTKKTVMITGASRGLGLALVRAFAPEATSPPAKEWNSFSPRSGPSAWPRWGG